MELHVELPMQAESPFIVWPEDRVAGGLQTSPQCWKGSRPEKKQLEARGYFIRGNMAKILMLLL